MIAKIQIKNQFYRSGGAITVKTVHQSVKVIIRFGKTEANFAPEQNIRKISKTQLEKAMNKFLFTIFAALGSLSMAYEPGKRRINKKLFL